ncbi:MAG: hypothetical protein GY851_07965 [bacterium]|nr:hypothetical protein [bacterium]
MEQDDARLRLFDSVLAAYNQPIFSSEEHRRFVRARYGEGLAWTPVVVGEIDDDDLRLRVPVVLPGDVPLFEWRRVRATLGYGRSEVVERTRRATTPFVIVGPVTFLRQPSVRGVVLAHAWGANPSSDEEPDAVALFGDRDREEARQAFVGHHAHLWHLLARAAIIVARIHHDEDGEEASTTTTHEVRVETPPVAMAQTSAATRHLGAAAAVWDAYAEALARALPEACHAAGERGIRLSFVLCTGDQDTPQELRERLARVRCDDGCLRIDASPGGLLTIPPADDPVLCMKVAPAALSFVMLGNGGKINPALEGRMVAADGDFANDSFLHNYCFS